MKRLQYREMKRRASLLFSLLLLFSVSGCLYPESERQNNQAAAKEYLMLVESAVQEYRTTVGGLPVKNSSGEQSSFKKPIIDFRKLKDAGVLTNIPPNAFESGGTLLYVMVNAENETKVRLADLVSYQTLMDVQGRVDAYVLKEQHLPLGDKIMEDYYLVDFDALGIEETVINSVYSELELKLLLHQSGLVGIDYSPEIMAVMGSHKTIAPDKDLRELLVERSYYLPIGSFPYHWSSNQLMLGEPEIY